MTLRCGSIWRAVSPTPALLRHPKAETGIARSKFGRRARALLPFAGDATVEEYLVATCGEIAALVEQVTNAAVSAINGYEFALVTGGMSDLYYLPIRISKLLGWAGFAVHATLARGEDCGSAGTSLADLFGANLRDIFSFASSDERRASPLRSSCSDGGFARWPGRSERAVAQGTYLLLAWIAVDALRRRISTRRKCSNS